MPRIATPLSDKEVQKAKPREKKYKLHDGGGLYLIVNPKGTKSWKLDYQIDAARKEISLGIYPVMTLKEAREEALRVKREISQGMDPLAEKKVRKLQRKEEKQNTEFDQKTQLHLVVDEWLELHDKKVTDYTARKTRALLYNNLLPAFSESTPKGKILSSTPISHIKHHQITDLLKEKAKETEYSAKRLKQFLGRVWLFAVTSGYCENNIIENISDEVLPSPKVKHIDKITDEKLLGKLLSDIDGYTGNTVVRAALQFVTYTMLRASTLVTLKWEYVDFENKTITIPREQMKVKDQNLNDFTMPLVDQAMAVLEELKPISGWSEYIFSIDGKPINKESGNKALRTLGYNDAAKGLKQTMHSFRGTFRSLAETHQDQHNAPYEVKEAISLFQF
ncbi:MAG: integrase arm-type DNA-binding domain-containing protein [Campylobacterales bacterium]|nr:integrase arm-type DNA-binding domain-containing protein [Campylobacterales bacterium]